MYFKCLFVMIMFLIITLFAATGDTVFFENLAKIYVNYSNILNIVSLFVCFIIGYFNGMIMCITIRNIIKEY